MTISHVSTPPLLQFTVIEYYYMHDISFRCHYSEIKNNIIFLFFFFGGHRFFFVYFVCTCGNEFSQRLLSDRNIIGRRIHITSNLFNI